MGAMNAGASGMLPRGPAPAAVVYQSIQSKQGLHSTPRETIVSHP